MGLWWQISPRLQDCNGRVAAWHWWRYCNGDAMVNSLMMERLWWQWYGNLLDIGETAMDVRQQRTPWWQQDSNIKCNGKRLLGGNTVMAVWRRGGAAASRLQTLATWRWTPFWRRYRNNDGMANSLTMERLQWQWGSELLNDDYWVALIQRQGQRQGNHIDGGNDGRTTRAMAGQSHWQWHLWQWR